MKLLLLVLYSNRSSASPPIHFRIYFRFIESARSGVLATSCSNCNRRQGCGGNLLSNVNNRAKRPIGRVRLG
uniref:Putative secreted peptide n=1 Tax=Anopheles braziliensis TaxID=58242 RepID=A0A2M3ZUQ1_9DIPT